MKKKRSIYESLNKDFKKGIKRFFWFSYTTIKYSILSLMFYLYKKKISSYKISLLLPTRERSQKFERMLNSLILTSFNKSRLEILLLLDENEPEINSYKKIVENNSQKINIKIIIQNLSTHALRNNYLASKSNGDILFPINDDLIFISKNWDNYLDLEFSKININKPNCLWIDSGKKYNYLHTDFPIINRSWYERLGYVGSEYFNFWYLDAWICDLSFKSKKFLVSRKIKVNQLSADTFQNECDNTFLKNKRNGIPEKDFVIWKNTESKRKLDAKKLL